MTDNSLLIRQNRALREEVDTLREQVRQLEATLRPHQDFPYSWRLSPQEQTLLAALRDCAPRPMSRDRAVIALYGAADGNHGCGVVYVLITMLRRKLEKAGVPIRIENAVSRGWYMPPESCAIFDTALAADQSRWPGREKAA